MLEQGPGIFLFFALGTHLKSIPKGVGAFFVFFFHGFPLKFITGPHPQYGSAMNEVTPWLFF